MTSPADKAPSENDSGLNAEQASVSKSKSLCDSRACVITASSCSVIAVATFYLYLCLGFGLFHAMESFAPGMRLKIGTSLSIVWNLLTLIGVGSVAVLIWRRERRPILAAIPAILLLAFMALCCIQMLVITYRAKMN